MGARPSAVERECDGDLHSTSRRRVAGQAHPRQIPNSKALHHIARQEHSTSGRRVDAHVRNHRTASVRCLHNDWRRGDDRGACGVPQDGTSLQLLNLFGRSGPNCLWNTRRRRGPNRRAVMAGCVRLHRCGHVGKKRIDLRRCCHRDCA